MHTGLTDKAVEFVYFSALAAVPLYALLCYGRHLVSSPRLLAYVLAGFALYGTAAIASVTRNWGGWYGWVGARIHEGLGMVAPEGMSAEESGHWLVDAVLEETLETLAATFLLLAAVVSWRLVADRGRPVAEAATRE